MLIEGYIALGALTVLAIGVWVAYADRRYQQARRAQRLAERAEFSA